ncbi:MAG: PEP/pyruvate-binding domain-containing protein [Bacteroidales bacterium]|nr:PEP/pyruvate-binding domain-containing protein [Bacteroidales bacterium]
MDTDITIIRPEDFKSTDYDSLIKFRIKRILMICSNYDAFIMEEDGQIESQVYKEYVGLNMSDPPTFVWAESSSEAKVILEKEPDIDIIICMYNDIDKDIFPLASEIKESGKNIPFVLLMHYSKEIRRKITSRPDSAVDFVFSWHGNADLILAIIKLFEDRKNADNDILDVGVQAILLVEDSIRYYSTYLPELYKLILTQSNEFLKETLNEDQQRKRKRSRPKILLATCYDEAKSIYEKYRNHFLGIISDVGMVVHKGDPPKTEKLDAGIDLVNQIRRDDPLMPVLLQSSQGSVAETAQKLGVGFLRKYSRTLFMQLSDYIKSEFGFGDFVFKDSRGVEYGRAANLQELEEAIKHVPDKILVSNTSRNMFSKWFFARGLFTLAEKFKLVHHDNATEARDFLTREVQAYHKAMGRGIIAEFSAGNYDRYISFARIGNGSLGGKARGLAFLNKLIDKYSLSAEYKGISISIPRTVVITTDYFDEFIMENGLQYVIDSELSDSEILSEFVASRLPERLISELKCYLKTVTTPLAIRSSSKLEDSNYQPFAGVYSTYMIPLTENRDQMLRMLDKAIKSVYASAYYNGSRTYIQSTGNLQSEEKMAVIVQNICGSEHNGLYYPFMSGVGRSVNFYPIANEKSEDGIVNIVFGLGKSVVEGGKTLRFSPKYPKKILQLSQPELAMRDCQKKMYALDLRPGAFKISRNEGVNFAHISVNEVISSYKHSDMVFSTYSYSDQRIVPGTETKGPRIVAFDAVLKYGKYPLARALSEIMDICRKELLGEVEMEFAADIQENGNLSLKLLQVRPISSYSSETDVDFDALCNSLETKYILSSRALGVGHINGMRHIVYIPPEKFDSARTREIAAEIAEINTWFKSQDGGYLLIGPGRWGSSDPNLGIPVSWSDISEARMIVEYGLPGFRVEPSQGTHFFQNITSLGIGYLSVDTVDGKDGSIDFQEIEKLEAVCGQYKYTTIRRTEKDIVAYIDHNTNRSVAGMPAPISEDSQEYCG